MWNKTLGEALKEWAARFDGRAALTGDGETLTYAEVYVRSVSCAVFFYEKGVRRGDRVIVQLPNTITFVTALFGLFHLGAVPVLCLPAHKERVVSGICEKVRPRAMLFARRYLANRYEEMAGSLASKYDCGSRLFFEDEVEIASQEKRALLPEVETEGRADPFTTAFMLLSGGTTGIPKLIARTHARYLYNAEVTARRLSLDERTVMLTVLPAAHNFALGTPGIIGTLMNGGRVVMQKYPGPEETLYHIEKERVTVTSLVPVLASMCIQYRRVSDEDSMESLQYVLVGGAMFYPDEARELEKRLACRVVQVYGMSEGMTFMTDPDVPDEIRFYYQGQPSAPEDVFRLIDANGQEIPPSKEGVPGEIQVKGPYTITGYYENPQANRESFTPDGYYASGDRAEYGPGGAVRITGRVREQINRAGEKIMPSALEEVVLGHPAVIDCAVAGIPDPLLGNRICVFAQTDGPLTLGELVRFLKAEQVADYYLPDRLEIVEQWPLTAVGKIDKNRLVERLEGEKQDGKRK